MVCRVTSRPAHICSLYDMPCWHHGLAASSSAIRDGITCVGVCAVSVLETSPVVSNQTYELKESFCELEKRLKTMHGLPKD